MMALGANSSQIFLSTGSKIIVKCQQLRFALHGGQHHETRKALTHHSKTKQAISETYPNFFKKSSFHTQGMGSLLRPPTRNRHVIDYIAFIVHRGPTCRGTWNEDPALYSMCVPHVIVALCRNRSSLQTLNCLKAQNPQTFKPRNP